MVGRLLREGREPQAESDGRAGGEEAGDDRELICAATVADALAGCVVGRGGGGGGDGLHTTGKIKEFRGSLARRKRRASDTGHRAVIKTAPHS